MNLQGNKLGATSLPGPAARRKLHTKLEMQFFLIYKCTGRQSSTGALSSGTRSSSGKRDACGGLLGRGP